MLINFIGDINIAEKGLIDEMNDVAKYVNSFLQCELYNEFISEFNRISSQEISSQAVVSSEEGGAVSCETTIPISDLMILQNLSLSD